MVSFSVNLTTMRTIITFETISIDKKYDFECSLEITCTSEFFNHSKIALVRPQNECILALLKKSRNFQIPRETIRLLLKSISLKEMFEKRINAIQLYLHRERFLSLFPNFFVILSVM